MGDFYLCGLVEVEEIADNSERNAMMMMMRSKFGVELIDTIYLLCQSISVDALNLIESWQFSDQRLASTIGSSDGRPYENLMNAALQEPLNQEAARHGNVSEAYRKYLSGVINRPYSNDIRSKL